MFLTACKHKARHTGTAHFCVYIFKGKNKLYRPCQGATPLLSRVGSLSCFMQVARLFVTAAFCVPQAASFVYSTPPAPTSPGFISRTHFSRFRSAGCPFLLCSPAVALGGHLLFLLLSETYLLALPLCPCSAAA